jgi:uncharacterized YkwD family protein
MKNKIIALTLSMILALSSTSAFAADRVYNVKFNIYDLLKNYGYYYYEQQPAPVINRAEVPSQEKAVTTENKTTTTNAVPATTAAPATTAPSTSNYEQKVAELVNIERQKNGLAPLTLDSAISNVARIKSKDMADNNYFAHQSPTYGSAGNMLTQFGIKWSAWGENIAAGQRTPEEVVRAWMNSEGHRANILSPNFSRIGVGYVNSARPHWTQMFTN